jgi:hypothetical protein
MVREGDHRGFFSAEAISPVMVSVTDCGPKLEEPRESHLLMNDCQAKGFFVILRDIGKDNTLVTCFMFRIGELLAETPLLLVLLSFCNENRLRLNNGTQNELKEFVIG